MASSSDITHDFPPFFKVYKDGSVERYLKSDRIPPGFDPHTNVQSKDVTISKESNISARIFLPKIDNHQKLPLLVHYHGGGFCAGSALSSVANTHFTNFVNKVKVLAISVEYRLAPEHPLPIAYDDSYEALQWIASHVHGKGPEPWLNQHANFDQVFLAGESAGATIAHDVAIRWGSSTSDQEMKIVGLMLVHPFFGRKEVDRMYKFLCPGSSGSDDDPRLNPGVDPRLAKLGCEKVLVCVAEKDWLKCRGEAYYESLKESGWGGVVEFVETKGVDHCFHVFNPGCDEAESLFQKLAGFINQDQGAAVARSS